MMARILRHTFCAGAVSASLLLAAASQAQSTSRSNADLLADLRACASLERDGARLACFDGVLAAEEPPPGGSATAAPSPRAEASVARAPQTSPAPLAAATTRVTPDETPPRGPQTQAPEESQDGRQAVTIVEINPQLNGDATFVTDTGQVYVQTSGREPPGGYPALPFETTLRDGALGSLFLYLSERQRVRVRIAE